MNEIKFKMFCRFAGHGVLPIFLLAPAFVLAAGALDSLNPLTVSTIPELICKIVGLVKDIGTPLVGLGIVYAGFVYTTAAGDTKKISEAHNALMYAVIGGALILGAYVIIGVIGSTMESIGGSSASSACGF